jgi:hypothetical protein
MTKPRVAMWLAGSLILLVSLFGTTCKVFEPTASKPPVRGPIQGAIDFDLREDYTQISDVGSPRIQLQLQTQTIYPCCNWGISHSVQVRPGNVGVEVDGISQPEICLTATGPAAAATFLDLANGSYALDISRRGSTDRFTLTVTDVALEVSGNGTVFQPRHARIWRYPHNSLLYLCGTTTETTAMCNECLERIRTAAGLQEFHFPPGGHIPFATESGGHWVDTPARYFTYTDEAAFRRAADALIAYSRDVIAIQNGIGISLLSWRNEPVYSWMYDRVP